MAINYGQMRRIPVDPRVIERIQKSPEMSTEQGTSLMEGWGGAGQYRTLARLPMTQRLCYAAILEGNGTQAQVEAVTGLSTQEASSGLSALQKKGLVKLEISEV